MDHHQQQKEDRHHSQKKTDSALYHDRAELVPFVLHFVTCQFHLLSQEAAEVGHESRYERAD